MLKIVEESDEVLFTAASLTLVDATDIEALKVRAEGTRRRRCRLCAHPSTADRLHEMIIVHGRDAYVRPHEHEDKAESLHVIEGTADMVCFDANGAITSVHPLGPAGTGRSFYYRMPPRVFHSLVISSDWFVFHEATSGPFDRAKTIFASWSPVDDGSAEADAYLARLRDQAAAALASPAQ